MSLQAAASIVQDARRRPDLLLCASAGSSPTRTYHLLGRAAESEPGLFERLRILKVDEWGGLPMVHPSTCETDLRKNLLGRLKVTEDRYHGFVSDAADPRASAAEWRSGFEQNGPVDICVLGLGTNGHVAMNEPAERFVLARGPPGAKFASASMLAASPVRPTHGRRWLPNPVFAEDLVARLWRSQARACSGDCGRRRSRLNFRLHFSGCIRTRPCCVTRRRLRIWCDSLFKVFRDEPLPLTRYPLPSTSSNDSCERRAGSHRHRHWRNQDRGGGRGPNRCIRARISLATEAELGFGRAVERISRAITTWRFKRAGRSRISMESASAAPTAGPRSRHDQILTPWRVGMTATSSLRCGSASASRCI